MTKTSETTVVALIGKDIEYIKKNLEVVGKDVTEIKNSNYVTGPTLAAAIQASEKKQSDDLQELKNDLSSIKKTLWGFGSFIILSVLAAILKLVFKV
jgi:hypothetical protein